MKVQFQFTIDNITFRSPDIEVGEYDPDDFQSVENMRIKLKDMNHDWMKKKMLEAEQSEHYWILNDRNEL